MDNEYEESPGHIVSNFRISDDNIQIPREKVVYIPYLMKIQPGVIHETEVEISERGINPIALMNVLSCIAKPEELRLTIGPGENLWKDIMKAAKVLGIEQEINIADLYLKSKKQNVNWEVMKEVLEEMMDEAPDAFQTSAFLNFTLDQFGILFQDLVDSKIFHRPKFAPLKESLYVNWLESTLRYQEIKNSGEIPQINCTNTNKLIPSICIDEIIPTQNIYMNADFMDRLIKLASKKDLSKLRQLNEDYERVISPNYFDICNKHIRFQSGQIWIHAHMPKAIRPICREITICRDYNPSFDEKKILQSFILSVGPYIKRLNLNHHGFQMLSSMSQEFDKIKNLDYLTLDSAWYPICSHIEQLRTMLTAFSSTTKIQIDKIGIYNIPTTNELLDFAQLFSNLKNVAVLGAHKILLSRVADLDLFFNHYEMISNMEVDELTIFDLDSSTIQDWEFFRKQFVELMNSWKCKTLRSLYHNLNDASYDVDLSLLPNIGSWKSNLTKLQLKGYSKPIVFISELPNLTHLLHQDFNIDTSLFPNTELTDEQNLRAIFQGKQNMTVQFSDDVQSQQRFATHIILIRSLVEQLYFTNYFPY